MSCSTTLSACTIKNTLTTEDPYVFTETAPTTPPIFNNSQKSRNRLVVKQLNTTQIATAALDSSKTINKDSSFSKVKNNGTKIQTTTSSSIKSAALNASAVLGVLNTNNIKYGQHSPKLQLESNQVKHTQHVLLAQNENAATLPTLVATPAAVSVINSRSIQQQKPQMQQKTQQHHQQQPQQAQLQKSQTPPPLLLSHTPSLWQTPLLLDNPKATKSTATTTATTAPLVKDVSAATAPFVPSLTRTPIKISFQPPTPTIAATALITPIAAIPVVSNGNEQTATTGGIAPLHLIMPSAAPLPPSNFHNTTLAQHLQKVQCLKKSKKSNSPTGNINITTQKIESTLNAAGVNPVNPVNQSPPAALTPISTSAENNTTQHSTNDLNEIPVNVIFRSPTKSNSPESNSPNDIANDVSAGNCDDMTKNRQMCTSNVKRLPTESNVEINLTMKFPGNGSNQSPKQSSKLNQKRKNSSTNSEGQQPKQRKLQKSISEQQKLATTEQLKNNANKTSSSSSGVKLKTSMDAKRKTTATMQKMHKQNCKVTFNAKSISELDESDFLLTENISSPTKAFAVIRMPYKEIEADDSLLAEESVMPYCLQRHWFNPNERSIRTPTVGREERIIEYKNLLRHQAMQLFATRSLQQIPFHIARKRLLCVDALLRKYRDHNKTVFSGSMVKRCDVENCANEVLQMSTYCQQHIVKNTKQFIFVQCSAKNLKDCQKPCDIPVLNIQKPYSAPLCFLHAVHRQYDANNLNKKASPIPPLTTQTNCIKRAATSKSTVGRKRKATTSPTYNKNTLNSINLSNLNASRTAADTLPVRTGVGLQRKNSTTSLESIASNSHSSFASSIQPGITTEGPIISGLYKQQQQQQMSNCNTFQTNMLSPPSLAPLSYNSNSAKTYVSAHSLGSDFTNSSHRESVIFGRSNLDPTAEHEINKLVAQFAMAAAATVAPTNNTSYNGNGNNNNNNNNNNSFNYMNTNSNSNLTSSGVGSSSSLPSTDELLTQDMLSICENSSAYASSSEDTGLGELSENELIGANGGGVGCGSGFNDDDVSPDEIPLGDTRLLEENDLVNVFGTLPVNLNELFNTVVRQDEREEVERALEIADKHLKTLQETIVSDSDFLADFLNVNDDMLADTEDICSKMEIVSSVLSPPESLDAATLYLENTENVLNAKQHGAKNVAITGSCVTSGNTNNSSVMDVRGLLQT